MSQETGMIWEIGDRQPLPMTVPSPPTPEADIWLQPFLAADFNLNGIDIYANTDCPYMCEHCFLTTAELKTEDRMSLELVNDILQWAVTPGSQIEEITLLGGEFSMHPLAAKIIKLVGNTRRLDGTFLRPRIVTNGGKAFQKLLEDEEVVALLRKSRVAVSVEAADEKLNDRFRGRGASHNAWKTVQMLIDKDIPADINCTVMRSTVHDIISLAERSRMYGVGRINIHLFSPIGRGYNLQHEALDPEEWRDFCAMMTSYDNSLKDNLINNFVVDVEFAYDFGILPQDVINSCAIADDFNLQFRPPKQGSQDCAVLACGLTMPDPDKSAYVFRKGNLFQRRGESEHRLVPLGSRRKGCPLPFRQQPEGTPQPICVYRRMDHKQVLQKAEKLLAKPFFLGSLAAKKTE